MKLKLKKVVFVDLSSSIKYFLFLKEFSLVSIRYLGGDEYVSRLLSNCLVLKNLCVRQTDDDDDERKRRR